MIKFRGLRAKRIIYLLSVKSNRELYEFSFGEGKPGQHKSMEILRRLIKKGIVSKINYKAMDSNMGCKYYLTDKGKEIAKPIVNEIDEYKGW